MTSDITIENEDSGVTFIARVEWEHYVGEEDGFNYFDWSLIGFQVCSLTESGQDFEFDIDEIHGWRFSPEFADKWEAEIHREVKELWRRECDYAD